MIELTKLGGTNPFANSVNQNVDFNRVTVNQSCPGILTKRTTRGTVTIPIGQPPSETSTGGGDSIVSVCRWAG